MVVNSNPSLTSRHVIFTFRTFVKNYQNAGVKNAVLMQCLSPTSQLSIEISLSPQ